MVFVDTVEEVGGFGGIDAMRDGVFPLQRAHGHILQHRPATRRQAVIARKEHLQPFAVGRQEMHRHGLRAVVALPHERAVRFAQRDGRVDALWDPRRLEHHIREIRRNLKICRLAGTALVINPFFGRNSAILVSQ